YGRCLYLGLRSPHKIRVMIADDNREFCQLLAEYLQSQEDMELVGVAHDGKEALDLLAMQDCDILLLDIIMPYLDGIGVLENLSRGGRPKPATILLTAFGQENISQQMANLGASYYILKPFHLDVLAERIRQIANIGKVPTPTRNGT